MVPNVVLGLDLSLRGAGLVAVPENWGGDWERIARCTIGERLSKDCGEARKTGRLLRIAADVVAFARTNGCTVAILEQYAFTSRFGREYAGELGGVVKHQLSEKLGIVPDVVSPSSARKLLLGKLPQKGSKDAARAALTAMGMPPSWSMDEGDAFGIANFALSGMGGFAFMVPPPVEEKRSRRKAA